MSIMRVLLSVVGLVICGAAVLSPGAAHAAPIIGHLSTPDASGMFASGGWVSPADGEGFRVDWEVFQNLDGTWHYAYTFSDEDGDPLQKKTSHVILQLSENIGESDLFNFTGDAGTFSFGTFGPHVSNPGFPAGESFFGVKVDIIGSQDHLEVDSTRQPMWGDIYVKDGKYDGVDTYAYNTDLGVAVANANDYMNIPVDGVGNPLAKLLVPDTIVPEPATLVVLGVGALALIRRR